MLWISSDPQAMNPGADGQEKQKKHYKDVSPFLASAVPDGLSLSPHFSQPYPKTGLGLVFKTVRAHDSEGWMLEPQRPS